MSDRLDEPSAPAAAASARPARGIFDGLGVVEAATFIAGPAAATILSDFGADVVKIEQPGLGDPWRAQFTRPELPACDATGPH